MALPRPSGSFWPSETQDLLLRVALDDPDETALAWQALRPRFDLVNLERGSFALLPLAYRALARACPDDSLLPRLKGIYRSTWVKNNLLLERLRESAREFAAAGIDAVLLGGIGTAMRYYGDLGLRPTPQIELLVAPGETSGAVAALARAGWSAAGRRDEAVALAGRGDEFCVLRTALAPDFDPWSELHAELRGAAEELDLRSGRVPVLAPSDELLAVCVAGARVGEVPTVQWIPDALHILRATKQAIDWDRLLRLVLEGDQPLRLRDALGYLARFRGATVPDEVRARLHEIRATPRQSLAHACASRSLAGLGGLPQALGRHLVTTSHLPVTRTVATFPTFLRERWGLEHAWQVPVEGGRRARRALAAERTKAR